MQYEVHDTRTRKASTAEHSALENAVYVAYGYGVNFNSPSMCAWIVPGTLTEPR
jgi:hypothetical protein